MKFSDVAKNVEKNNHEAKLKHDAIVNRIKGVPEHYDGMEERKTRGLTDKFTINGFHIVEKPDTIFNKESKVYEVKTSKRGNVLTIKLVYCDCNDAETGDRFYFCTRSQEMITQLAGLAEPQVKEYENQNGHIIEQFFDVAIDDVLKLGAKKVKYADGEDYTQPILTPAE